MRLLLTALALATALALGACGSDDDDDSSSSTATVSLSDGVLVDSEGAALYTSEEEAGGDVLCIRACAEIWLPLTASNPTAASDVTGRLGVVKRPDGARQVTYDGKPVYRFADDGGPGDVTGDGLSDNFDGQRFTWHVIGERQPPSGSNGGSYSY